MRYNVIFYLIGEGIHNVLKNKKSTVASLMIMCATMIIFGLFFVIGENVNYFMNEVQSSQGIQVFIDNEATDQEIEDLGKSINMLDGVNTADFVSKDEALDQLMKRFEDRSYLLDVYKERKIFPASYVVTLTDLNLSTQVQKQISEMQGVKRITSSDETITTLINLANGIKIVTFVILILLIVISIFIIANTIKLTVHARRREISIMKYVGATNGFIRWPFIIEGVVIGVIAGAISVALVGGAYDFVASKLLSSEIMQVVKMSLVNFSDMFSKIIAIYLLLGSGIGVLGSVISMRKYLEV